MKLRMISEQEVIPGGLAKSMPESDFDPQALAKGIKVELEHTSDEKIAKEIAKDHLVEDPKYYDKLEKMEESKGLFHNINKRRKKGISRKKSESTIDPETYDKMKDW